MMNGGKAYDVVVIGGGAAGLLAAGKAALSLPGRRVLLLEKMEKVGRKIRITGKGRCNLTNNKSETEFLEKVRSGAEFVRPAFEAFSNEACVRFFESVGVKLTTERGGRIFPAGGDAWEIAQALERWCRESGAEIRCNTPVTGLLTDNGRIVGVRTAGETIPAGCVIAATGGISYPRTGSTGDGHRFAHDTGHAIVPLRPSLVPFEIALPGVLLARLKGLLLKNIELTLLIDGQPIQTEFGEMEFFGFGVGGATVFRVSRKAVDALYDGRTVDFRIDLKPALPREKLLGRFTRETEADPQLTAEGLLRKLLPAPLIPLVTRRLPFPLYLKAAGLSAEQREALIRALKELTLEVTDHRGFGEAVVTAGGVSLEEVDPRTMESKRVEGLFFAGELLDLDADTGGYNLQLAFSTGFLAGNEAAKKARP